jgi:HEAT repeat protein
VRSFYQPLLSLLADEDLSVRRAALIAADRVPSPRLLPLIIDNLKHLSLRSAAMTALVRSGNNILPIAAKALAGQTQYDEEDVIRLVRACGEIKGQQVTALLKQHLNHPDDDVQYQVLSALDQCGYRAEGEDIQEIEHTLRGEAAHGLRTQLAKQDIGEDESLTHLHRALDYEFEQACKRVFLLLSFMYDSRAVLRAGEQILRGSSGDKAMALETLDVTISGPQKSLLFELADESTPLEHRVKALSKGFTLRNITRSQRLTEIIADPEKVWTHGWTRACAIYAAAKLTIEESVDAVEDALSIAEHPIRETAAWALHELAPEKYRSYAAELAEDSNPQVAKLAAYLVA